MLLGLQSASYYFTINLQQLGALDCRLILEDRRYAQLTLEQKKTESESRRRFEHYGSSALWVMGGFQLVDVLEKQVETAKWRYGLKSHIERTKMKFLRLRSPFAKAKASSGDYPYPCNAGQRRGSVCWALNSQTLVSRIELSDAMLTLFAHLAKFWPQVTGESTLFVQSGSLLTPIPVGVKSKVGKTGRSGVAGKEGGESQK